MKNRWIIYALVASLVVLLIILGAQLPRDLRALSRAESDNTRWTVLQVETELANLSAILAEEVSARVPDSSAVRLRTDIALSRTALILEGQGRELLGGTPEVEALLVEVSGFRDAAIEIVDQPGPLSQADVMALVNLTTKIRPAARQLALLGLSQDTARADQRRAEFATKLRVFGFVALSLIALLVVALLYLDRLFALARLKDQTIRVSSERLEATVAASLDGIVIANEAGEIIDFNDAATNIFGWDRDEIVGLSMDATIVPHQHRAAHASGMARYLSTREPHVVDAGRIELTALRKTGEEFPIELNITSSEGEGGTVFIAYVRDISERKVSEKKLIDARELAERTDRAKSNFLTVMSHEMRTPLNGILGVLDLLKTTTLDPRQARYVQVAAASGEILLEHVNEALDITRIEAGVMSLAPEVFSLKSTVMRVVDVLRTLAEEKGLTLDVEYDPGMDRHFFADAVRVNQLLTNLIGNAIKFTETGGILVRVAGIHQPLRTNATISVTDTGSGIPEEKLEDIFEDFVALAQPSGRQRRGDGLGLSISRKVARLMDGELTVESTLGEGSTFTLDLPLERAEGTRTRVKSRPMVKAEKKRILIVEDNAINRSVLKEMLVGLGHEVTEAENGLEGLKRTDKVEFDLIVMDISMPFMDGIEATRRIREGKGLNQQTYIMGLTAHGRQEFRLKAQAAGMDGFCTKPLRLADLQGVLEGMDPARPSDGGSQALAHDVLGDLLTALGAEKLSEAADQFFVELDEGLESLKAQSPGEQSPMISESLHKMRGAAVVLGMTDLAQAVDRASAANKNDDATDFAAALDEIDRVKASMPDALAAWLAEQTN